MENDLAWLTEQFYREAASSSTPFEFQHCLRIWREHPTWDVIRKSWREQHARRPTPQGRDAAKAEKKEKKGKEILDRSPQIKTPPMSMSQDRQDSSAGKWDFMWMREARGVLAMDTTKFTSEQQDVYSKLMTAVRRKLEEQTAPATANCDIAATKQAKKTLKGAFTPDAQVLRRYFGKSSTGASSSILCFSTIVFYCCR